jgi:hypothetical protein
MTYRSDKTFYAWVKITTDGEMIVKGKIPAHYCWAVVPGMGQWVHLRLKEAIAHDALPDGLISTNDLADALDGIVAARNSRAEPSA